MSVSCIGRAVAFALSLALPVLGGAQIIRGRVVDSTGAPVRSAQVRVLPNGSTSLTNAAGAFTVNGLRAGMYRFDIRRIGFVPDTVEVRVPLQDSVLTIILVTVRTVLPGVTISALHQDLPRLFERMDEHLGSVEFGDDLRKKFDGVAVDDILKDDFKLSRYASHNLHGYCGIFIDGILLSDVPPAHVSDHIRMGDVAAIEAFRSPDFINEPFINGQFVDRAQRCGTVILIWSKGYKQKPWVGGG